MVLYLLLLYDMLRSSFGGMTARFEVIRGYRFTKAVLLDLQIISVLFS